MKLVVAEIRPEKVNDVLEALFRADDIEFKNKSRFSQRRGSIAQSIK